MNKVNERCGQNKHSKFYYASNRIFFELKFIKAVLYLLAIVTVVLTFIPQVTDTQKLICSIVSFSLTVITECATSFLNKHKDNGIHSLQLYETGVTGTTFSKIEYDREMTNELNELAIRKGLPKLQNIEQAYVLDVPKDIPDDYSYLYTCRINAATNKYILSRIFYINFFFLMTFVGLFIGAIFFKTETSEYLTLIIAFYPIISPIIKACNSCKECMRYCTKLCADIDNFFADGDDSVERLARMHYYVQQVEYEMYRSRPVIFNFFRKMFNKGVEVLQSGVTDRFRSSIVELKQKALITKGIIAVPKGKSLIVHKDYDMEYLKKKEKQKRQNKAQKPQNTPKSVQKPAQKPAAKKSAAKPKTAKK